MMTTMNLYALAFAITIFIVMIVFGNYLVKSFFRSYTRDPNSAKRSSYMMSLISRIMLF